MKNRRLTWLLLLVFLVNIFSTVFTVFSVNATENAQQIHKIISNNELKIEVTSEEQEERVHWNIQYEKNEVAEKNQKLKFRLIDTHERIPFPDQEKWQLDGSNTWFIEEEWTYQSQGEVHFTTEKNQTSLLLEVQVDSQELDEEKNEIIKENILESDLQGPYELIHVRQETALSESVEILESNTGTSTRLEESFEETQSTEVDKLFDSQENENQVQSFQKSLISRQNETSFDYDYNDPFQYINNQEGIFPSINTNHFLGESGVWTNEGETTRNFNYGQERQAVPPTVNVLGNQLDFTNGYHQYQNPNNPNNNKSNILTKKTVKPTADPNEFEIELDVIGGASELKKPTDIVFVIDRSGSMGRDVNDTVLSPGDGSNPNSRWAILKKAMDKFSKELLVPGYDLRMSLVGFGSDWSNQQNTAVWATQSQFNGGSSFTTSATTLMSSPILTEKITTSGTPTYLGVDLGAKVLEEEGRANAVKYLIVLTDGAPTFYSSRNLGIANATVSNSLGLKKYELRAGNFSGNGSESVPNQTISYINDRVYNRPDVEGFEKFAIGFGIPSSDQGAVNNVLANIAEQAHLPENQRNRVINAGNNRELEDALEIIKRQIFGYTDTFAYGVLTDPMSEYVELLSRLSEIEFSALILKEDEPKELQVISQQSTAFPEYALRIKENAEIQTEQTNETIRLSQMNLGAVGQERHGIRLNYRVQLKENYRDGKYYPTNGPTSTKAFNYDEALGFAVPSVRSPSVDLLVEKQWIGDEEHQELRQDILLQLQRRDPGSEWEDVPGQGIIIKKDAEHLTGTFENLPEIKEMLLENQKATTVPFEYRVVEERVPGYEIPEIKPDLEVENGIIVRNKLLTTDLLFSKVDQSGESLAGAEFTLFKELSDGTQKQMKVITDPEEGIFIFESLAIGKYLLKETKTPDGFRTREPISFQIIEGMDEGKPVLRILDFPDDFKTEGLQIKNERFPSYLSILKIDSHSNQPLAGVVFSLTLKESEVLLATAVSDSNGVGEFKTEENQLFIPEVGQTYEIKETSTQEGYLLSPSIFELTLLPSGEILLTESGETYEEISITPILNEEEQVTHTMIQLKMFNTPKGRLPMTGGLGRQNVLITSLIIFGVGATIGGFYWYRNRKETN